MVVGVAVVVLLLVNVIADSLAWYERSEDGHTVCADCVRHYNSAVSIVSLEPADTRAEPPPFMFRPVKDEPDSVWKHVCVHIFTVFLPSISMCSFLVIGHTVYTLPLFNDLLPGLSE